MTEIIAEIVEYLNDKAGRRYNPETRQTQKLIIARLNEGFAIEDFKQVIDNKCKLWNHVPEGGHFDGRKYLRPSTLFGEKFDEYLNEPE